jgi:hypothetical protein
MLRTFWPGRGKSEPSKLLEDELLDLIGDMHDPFGLGQI